MGKNHTRMNIFNGEKEAGVISQLSLGELKISRNIFFIQ
jgi:hypothetical protein